MRRITILIALACALVGLVPASALAHGEIRDRYTCRADYANYTGCAVIRNEIQSWVGPGRLGKVRPLVFAGWQQVEPDWIAQREIPADGTGDAIVGGGLHADGGAIYSFRQTVSPQNYQALVTFRLSSGGWANSCIESSYLDCTMGPELETGRDSKHVFTVTSRPFEVRILNGMPQDLKRVDGPYWSNALWNPAIDSAGRIAPGAAGSVGSLRSVMKASAYAAVYKFQRSEEDPRYNGASVLISIRANANGTYNGKCTPVFAPSDARFACTVGFNGLGTAALTAVVRVSPS